MFQPQRWGLGLFPLFSLGLLAGWCETPRIERSIAQGATAALMDAGKDFIAAGATVQGRDVTLRGEALLPTVAERIAGRVQTLPAVRLVETSLSVAAPRSRYLLSVTREGKSLAFHGYYPDDGARAALIDKTAAAFAGFVIADKREPGGGAPSVYGAAGELAISHLGRMAAGRASLVGHVYSLEGVAASSADYASLLDAVASLPAGLERGTAQISPPWAEAYLFSAKISAGRLELRGMAPDIASRAGILAAASGISRSAVLDELEFASGAPPAFAPAVRLGLALLAKMGAGEFRLEGDTFGLTGTAQDADSYSALLASIQALPQGIERGTVAIAPPLMAPFRWEVRRDGDAVVVEGGVASEALRARLLAQAHRLLPGLEVIDRMHLASGAPAGFEPAALLALGQALQLKDGAAALVGHVWSFRGEAADAASAQGIAAALKGLPQPFQLGATSISVAVKKPEPGPAAETEGGELPARAGAAAETSRPAYQPATPAPDRESTVDARPQGSCPAGQRIWQATLYFDEGAFVLSRDADESLRGALDALTRCGRALALIEGHTNSHGDRQSNIVLSSLRSFAVSRWLQARGVPLQRIRTLGYGEDRPLASERHEDGVVKNRRVEISVQSPAR